MWDSKSVSLLLVYRIPRVSSLPDPPDGWVLINMLGPSGPSFAPHSQNSRSLLVRSSELEELQKGSCPPEHEHWTSLTPLDSPIPINLFCSPFCLVWRPLRRRTWQRADVGSRHPHHTSTFDGHRGRRCRDHPAPSAVLVTACCGHPAGATVTPGVMWGEAMPDPAYEIWLSNLINVSCSMTSF